MVWVMIGEKPIFQKKQAISEEARKIKALFRRTSGFNWLNQWEVMKRMRCDEKRSAKTKTTQFIGSNIQESAATPTTKVREDETKKFPNMSH